MRNTADRFWTKVNKRGPRHPHLGSRCWVWTASLNPNGYGMFGLRGRPQIASRVAWELTHGPIPSGRYVCHHCDNPPCVNPAHLFVGTAKDNSQDALRKGRAFPPLAALNKHKAACLNGHPFSEDNTYTGPDGKRCCIQCRRVRGLAHHYRNHEKRSAAKRERRLRANGGVSRACGDRTHCPKGHAYDDANTAYKPGGNRRCRACEREWARGRRRKIREQATA